MSDNMYNLDLEELNQAGANIGMTHDALPFPCPVFYVINGQAAYAESKTRSLFFGGWATDMAKYQSVLAQANRQPYSLLQQAKVQSRGGKDIDIMTSRALLVSPACTRTSWVSQDGKTRTPSYHEGFRRHVQILCALADKGTDGKYSIWGPAVLSAKGMQGKKLLATLDEWAKHTVDLRTKVAAGMPAFVFYMAIGTFAAQREVEMVGSGSQQSPITPIGIYKPELNAEKLGKLYGGEPLLKELRRLQQAASTWVTAWDKESSAPAGQAPSDLPIESEESEIPF